MSGKQVKLLPIFWIRQNEGDAGRSIPMKPAAIGFFSNCSRFGNGA
jgi:hypothetical protein